MKILVHDLSENFFDNLKDSFEIISTDNKAVPCQGCFKCWTKNAGYCVYADKLQHSGAAVGSSEKIVVVSEICYGGYSVGIKRFFDRGISDCSPFLTYRKGKTYHINRYKIKRKLVVYFYGNCSEFERETAREYVSCQAVNMDAEEYEVIFMERADDLRRYEL